MDGRPCRAVEALPSGIPQALLQRAHAAAAWLRERRAAGDTVTVVHHVDADGVSAGAIALECLQRAGIPHDSICARSLDDVHVAQVQGHGADALWFCDFGSTVYMHFADTPRLVCDHHELVRDGGEESFPHVNPLLDGLPGDSISGAGCAYLVAAALEDANLDLLPLALVGATGDLQDRRRGGAPEAPSDGPPVCGGFHGANAALLAHGQKAGILEVRRDVAWYGTETRPLRKFLSLARDPEVPGVSRDRRGVETLLAELDIPLLRDGTERTWSGLEREERLRLRSALVDRMLDADWTDAAAACMRDAVLVAHETPGTPVRELQEAATLLNSTARYDRPEVGLAVARGDRADAYGAALELMAGHRRHLVGALEAFSHCGVQETATLQWVHLQDHVRDTVVGIVCGMALEGLGLRRDVPLLGFAHAADGRTKVSARAPHELAGRIDLADVMRTASQAVGGAGGGHKGAAGATIPRGREADFLEAADGLLAGQLGMAARPTPPRSSPAHAPGRGLAAGHASMQATLE